MKKLSAGWSPLSSAGEAARSLGNGVRALRTWLVLLMGAGLLAACDQGPAPDAISTPQERVVIGVASKGPLRNAEVRFFSINPDGSPGLALDRSPDMTDASGAFMATDLPADVALLAVTTGGDFVDESDINTGPGHPRKVALGTTEGFVSVLAANATKLAITPYTQALYLKARRQAAGTEVDFLPLYNALLTQAGNIFGLDVTTVLPADPLNPKASIDSQAQQYAMLLGGAANAINAIALKLGRLPDFTIINAFIEDLSDGALDGQCGSVACPPINDRTFPDDVDLNNEVRRFRNNNYDNYQLVSLAFVDEFAFSAVINTLPVAVDDAYSTPQNTLLELPPPGILLNDTDADGNSLTAILVTGPGNGALQIFDPDGHVHYRPNSGFTGTDRFTYKVNDGLVDSNVATVTITVAAGVEPLPAFWYLPYRNATAEGGGDFLVKSDDFRSVTPVTAAGTPGAPTTYQASRTGHAYLNGDTSVRNFLDDRLAFMQGGKLFYVGLRAGDSLTPVRFSSETGATPDVVCDDDGPFTAELAFASQANRDAWYQYKFKGPDLQCNTGDDIYKAAKLSSGAGTAPIVVPGYVQESYYANNSTVDLLGFSFIEKSNGALTFRDANYQLVQTPLIASGVRDLHEEGGGGLNRNLIEIEYQNNTREMRLFSVSNAGVATLSPVLHAIPAGFAFSTSRSDASNHYFVEQQFSPSFNSKIFRVAKDGLSAAVEIHSTTGLIRQLHLTANNIVFQLDPSGNFNQPQFLKRLPKTAALATSSVDITSTLSEAGTQFVTQTRIFYNDHTGDSPRQFTARLTDENGVAIGGFTATANQSSWTGEAFRNVGTVSSGFIESDLSHVFLIDGFTDYDATGFLNGTLKAYNTDTAALTNLTIFNDSANDQRQLRNFFLESSNPGLSGFCSFIPSGQGPDTVDDCDIIAVDVSATGPRFRRVTLTPNLLELVPGDEPGDPTTTAVLFNETFETGSLTRDLWTVQGGFDANTTWHVHDSGLQITNGLVPDYVSLAPGDTSNGAVPDPIQGSAAYWYGSSVNGNFIGEQTVGDQLGSGGTSTATHSGRLVSPPINLSAVSGPVRLSFKTWWEIESIAPSGVDILVIEVSTDGGANWITVQRLNPLSDPAGAADDLPFSNQGFNTAPQWIQERSMTLPGVAGASNVLVSFLFNTNDELFNGFRGWLVDDVIVESGEGNFNVDSDGDSVADRDEELIGTNPNDQDSDDDGLTDGEEVFQFGTDPLNPDTDGDEFDDGAEVTAGSDPHNPADTPNNDPPQANDDFYTAFQGVTLNIPAPGVLGNDFDPDATSPTAVAASGSTANFGTFSLSSDGSFTYSPPSPDFTGADSFTYQATDGVLNSAAATVTITVGGPAAPFQPFVNAAMELRLLDPGGAIFSASNPTAPLDTEVDPASPSFEFVTFHAASISGTTATNVRQARLVYFKNGSIFKVNLETGVRTQVSNITDATCGSGDEANDFANPDNSWVNAVSPGDGICGNGNDVKTVIRIDTPSTSPGIPNPNNFGFAGIQNSSGAVTGFLTAEIVPPASVQISLACRDATYANPLALLNIDSPVDGGPTTSKYQKDISITYIKLVPTGAGTSRQLFRYDHTPAGTCAASQRSASLYTFITPGFDTEFEAATNDATDFYFADGNKLLQVPHNATSSSQTVLVATLPAGQNIRNVQLSAAGGTGKVVFDAEATTGEGGVFSVAKTATGATVGAGIITLRANTLSPSNIRFGIRELQNGLVYITEKNFTANTVTALQVSDDGVTTPFNMANAYWAGTKIPTSFDFANSSFEDLAADTVILADRNPGGGDTLKVVNPSTGIVGIPLGLIPGAVGGIEESTEAFGVGRYSLITARIDRGGTTDFDVYFIDTQNADSLLGVPTATNSGVDDVSLSD